jgi:hypothetical protein
MVRFIPLPLVAAAVPLTAAWAASAKDTVDAIYRALPGSEFDYRMVRYAPPLKRLLAREAIVAHREVGLIDAMPFCDCQDTAEDYAFTSSSSSLAPDRAQVTVHLRNEMTSTYRVDMVRLATGWAVADLHGPEHPSLAAWLRANLPPERPRRTSPAARHK